MSARRTVAVLVCVLVVFSFLYSLGVTPLLPKPRPELVQRDWRDLDVNVTAEVCGVACNASRWWNRRLAAPRYAYRGVQQFKILIALYKYVVNRFVIPTSCIL
jgi:hypothetical protein